MAKTVTSDVRNGRALHVMRALCRHARQVVVTDAARDGTDTVRELLRTGQRLADQTGHTWASWSVEALDMVGWPC